MIESINPVSLIVTVALLSLLPLFAVTSTAFLKISAVLLILRNAIGVQQLPSNMVLYGVATVMTILVMGPIFKEMAQNFAPGDNPPQSGIEMMQGLERALPPLKKFMFEHTNKNYLDSFHSTAQKFAEKNKGSEVNKLDLTVLLPAFVASELAEAFRIGLLLYLPFVIIDLAVSSALMALGMMMVSPMSITVPAKILLFVAIEGWSKVFQSLVQSYL
ncbi:MAG: type III secretion system export apparatus subunit SctR [Gammaproteobacteria bacterium]|uniref:type III secretion system export apparatus subunit SctR n=1 Tax=Limnobacter sp. TaxID=2003368 RepID=UPI001D990EA7|nr:type III secretion system export apparatus subunit SctR [Limnobacter sp.]MBU0785074.1 type III secretion system export apparatus subunit SctR [Gammaproteobacteria bacterium]MBU0849112.1 type III secretion system export apparatus subunit SctR [Gammaproteobacteria bacterium]MBU1781449.1 type III secretion system export apparatus subunit SctR [Gammaproteobacteria bacterium]MBU2086829.1 type III secretion system export apparatus subunit SctR [Gammaproteobacteria bacterium]MBU2129806.1 type III 